MSPHRFSIRATALAAILLTVWTGAPPASAQDQAPPPPEPIALTERAFEIQSLDMTLRLPVGARLDTSRVGGAHASFTLYGEENTWIMRLHTPRSRDASLTADRVAENLYQELRESRKAVLVESGREISAVELIDRNDELVINGMPASRFYARVPRADGVVLVRGYTIFRTAPGRFTIFQLDCLESEFRRARNAYETTLATVEHQDPAEAAEDRAAGVIAGDRLLSQFNTDDLRSMMPEERQFFRLYRPGGSDSDDREVAYQVVQMRYGQRGEIDPAKPKSQWRRTDRDWGIVVTVKARFLDGQRIIDSETHFFLSTNRSKEAWSMRMAIRRGRDSAIFTETGVRDGDSIEVTVDQPGQPPSSKRWSKPPEGYLSQVETFLLPAMMTRIGAETEFAFYTYQSQHNEIVFRRDILERSTAPGQWIIRTKPTEDSAFDRAIVDEDGLIIRKELSSGVVMEAVKPDRLQRLWRSKGLPTE